MQNTVAVSSLQILKIFSCPISVINGAVSQECQKWTSVQMMFLASPFND